MLEYFFVVLWCGVVQGIIKTREQIFVCKLPHSLQNRSCAIGKSWSDPSVKYFVLRGSKVIRKCIFPAEIFKIGNKLGYSVLKLVLTFVQQQFNKQI